MTFRTIFNQTYPWTKAPVVCNAPMLNIAAPPLAQAVSEAGGLGFIAAGLDVSSLEDKLRSAQRLAQESLSPKIQEHHARTGILPVGVGFINWGADLEASVAAFAKYTPCAAWLFAPRVLPGDLKPWVQRVRAVTAGKTQIWVQVGTVAEAVDVVREVGPEVLVVQGADAGGHGLARSASVVTLVPEVLDALAGKVGADGKSPVIMAAGGITDGRGLAASLALGASGAVMGTRFLACEEASVARGYQAEILRASDGGCSTVRSTVYDRVRGILGWPERYNGRGVINQSYVDAVENGLSDEENTRLYNEETKKGDDGWGPSGRMTTYAGTGVGLVRETLPAAAIVENSRNEAERVMKNMAV